MLVIFFALFVFLMKRKKIEGAGGGIFDAPVRLSFLFCMGLGLWVIKLWHMPHNLHASPWR
jgi:hypothetical protein